MLKSELLALINEADDNADIDEIILSNGFAKPITDVEGLNKLLESDKSLQGLFDKKVTTGIENFKKNGMQKIIEAEVLKRTGKNETPEQKEIRELKERLDKADKEKAKADTEKLINDMEKITVPAECPYTLDELNNLIGDVDKRMEEVRESLQQYNRQLEDMQEQLDMRDEKELELAHSIEQQEEDIHKYDIYDTTANYLQMAKEQFTARYMAPISNGFRKYYEILTQNEEENWTVDANMKLRVKEQGELRDTQWLSRGWQDLIGVCMRFALVDAMYPEEKPFLVLDDPFVNLDDDKLARGKELLIALEKEYQAIYFTCHESREYKE